MIKEIPINDNWLYRRGFLPECLERDFDWNDSFIVQLPHNVKCECENYFDDREMRTVGTYSRMFAVSDAYCGKRLLLRFEGVLSYVEVYVNGIFVTSHKGEAPFVADITAPVKYNYDNRIVLKVDSSAREDFGFGARGALAPFGGIHRDVVFMICDGRDIKDVCIRTAAEGESVAVTADVELYDYYPDTEVSGEILDADGKRVCEFASRIVQSSSLRLRGLMSEPVCWEPDNPALYTAVIKLKSGKKTLDSHSAEFGFCWPVFKRDGFYLNGKLIKLIGVNRADCYPHFGRAATSESERQDARIVKALGCNAVRTMGLASKDFIDECNRIGLMVIEDVYGDGYIGESEWREAFCDGVTDMILRDRNNPSVIAWGVRVNNSADCDELYFKVNKAARAADPTRATLGARCFTSSRMYEDVFAFNEVHRTSRKKRKRSKLFVPYVISEHSGSVCAAKSGDRESVRLNQALRHLEAISDVNSGAAIGAFGMSMSDFVTPRAHGDGDSVNHTGVLDSHRNRKLAAYAYLSQSDSEPVLEPSSNLSECDFTGKLYLFTNADSVVMYRNGEKAGEFFPDRKTYPALKHPPVIIDDFCGNLPAAEVGEGLGLKLFKSILRDCEKSGLAVESSATGFKTNLLGKLRKLSKADIRALVGKYARIPEGGATYKFEAIYGGEVKKTRIISRELKKTLRISASCEGVLECKKSYERIAFSLFAEDGHGAPLGYCSAPYSVMASGSLSVEGSGHFSLSGGVGGFYVRSIAPGVGRVTVTSEFGTRTMEFDCVYGAIEKF